MPVTKEGISSLQLHRMLGVTKKTAWFLGHRIRASLADHAPELLGGEGKRVEADETFWGKSPDAAPTKRGRNNKRAIFTMVERGGASRSVHLPVVTRDTLTAVATANVDPASILNTDEALRYRKMGKAFADHATVNHSRGEYSVGRTTTNSVEGFFSVLKRGLYGTYQAVDDHHFHRYLAEFDFRYSNREKLGIDDRARMRRSLKGITGKRLTYRQTIAPKA